MAGQSDPTSGLLRGRSLDLSQYVPHESLFASFHLHDKWAPLTGTRVVLEAPARHFKDDRQQIQRLLGRRITKLSFVLSIMGLSNQTLFLEPEESIGQDIRRDPFF